MKYCPPCRLRAKDDEEKCSRCGSALRSMGGPPASASSNRSNNRSAAATGNASRAAASTPRQAATPTSSARRPQPTAKAKPAADAVTPKAGRKPVDDSWNATSGGDDNIQFQLAGLQQEVQRSSLRVRILAGLAAVLAISFIGLLFYLRHSYIMQFAEVDQLEIVRSDLHTGTALVRFRPLTAGRIQFVRNGAGTEETLLEYATGPTPDGEFKEFHWAGDADGQWSISIRYREGSDLIDRDWQSAKGSKSWKPESTSGGGVLATIGL